MDYWAGAGVVPEASKTIQEISTAVDTPTRLAIKYLLLKTPHEQFTAQKVIKLKLGWEFPTY